MKNHRAIRFLSIAVLLAVISVVFSTPSSAQIAIGISVRIGPPALPVYEQPLCPGPGYLWTPGYWAWDDVDGYYWVPGTWVVAPVGLLWTPGYWGWSGGVYAWHAGYWGPHIGFYGGINYGFGYGGVGFVGGEWRGGAFFYNTAVMHVDTVHITNVYVNRTVIVNNTSHVAFNGGEGGVVARPTAQEEAYAREPHQAALAAQTQQEHLAHQDRSNFASVNHGAPRVAATARPGDFNGRGVVASKSAGAPYHAPAMSPREARASAPAESRNEARSMNAANRENRAGNRTENNSRPAQQNARPAERESKPASEARPANQSKPAKEAKPAKPAKQNNPPKEEREKSR
jgi:hypothetical protein